RNTNRRSNTNRTLVFWRTVLGSRRPATTGPGHIPRGERVHNLDSPVVVAGRAIRYGTRGVESKTANRANVTTQARCVEFPSEKFGLPPESTEEALPITIEIRLKNDDPDRKSTRLNSSN